MPKRFDSLEEALKHGKPFSDLCRCPKCGTYWWLMDFLRCPKCQSNDYEEVEIPGQEYVKY